VKCSPGGFWKSLGRTTHYESTHNNPNKNKNGGQKCPPNSKSRSWDYGRLVEITICCVVYSLTCATKIKQNFRFFQTVHAFYCAVTGFLYLLRSYLIESQGSKQKIIFWICSWDYK
jgi:hypothetical protein